MYAKHETQTKTCGTVVKVFETRSKYWGHFETPDCIPWITFSIHLKKIEVLNQKYLQKGTWDGKAILHKLNPPPVPSGFFRMEKAKHEAKMENGVLQGGLRGQLSMVNLSASLACSPTCLSSCTSVGRDIVVTTGIRPSSNIGSASVSAMCGRSSELRATSLSHHGHED